MKSWGKETPEQTESTNNGLEWQEMIIPLVN